MASHPSTALPTPPSTSSASRSTTTGPAPSAATSDVCSRLRTSPLTSCPSSTSIRVRRLAVLPCAPAIKTLTRLPPLDRYRSRVYTRRVQGGSGTGESPCDGNARRCQGEGDAEAEAETDGEATGEAVADTLGEAEGDGAGPVVSRL